jgi:hypothetical protein
MACLGHHTGPGRGAPASVSESDPGSEGGACHSSKQADPLTEDERTVAVTTVAVLSSSPAPPSTVTVLSSLVLPCTHAQVS